MKILISNIYTDAPEHIADGSGRLYGRKLWTKLHPKGIVSELFDSHYYGYLW